ncbi:beta-ketoacyl synthase N-terminal-like domain-containing protein [Streptomyces sp. NPDC087219]|uniref:beta-ketoacyl synthase N-terminal-like domain-containing protein n=1 Tax=unclassified Streptomyces TaxID=2593676 RepID=UPI003827ACF5
MRTRVVISGLGTALAGVSGPGALLGAGGPADGPDPVSELRGPGLRYKDRATKLALAAAERALRDAGLLDADGSVADGSGADRSDFGVVVSTNWGNVDTVCDTSATIRERGYAATSPMLLPNTASNVTASWVAITHGLRGANMTLCNGPTSGLDAVHWARNLIASGRLTRALVIGVEPVNAPVERLVGGGGDDVRLLDGAVALVAEAEEAVPARGGRSLAAVGPYARRSGLAAAVSEVRRHETAPPGLWYLPEAPLGTVAPAHPDPGSVPTHDLSARFGRCSGALGVLQCVAATAELARTGHPSVLTSAGHGTEPGRPGTGDDAAAALLLLSSSASGGAP